MAVPDFPAPPQVITPDFDDTFVAARLPPRRWIRELGWRHLVLVLGVLFALFPIAWIISSSINPVDSLALRN